MSTTERTEQSLTPQQQRPMRADARRNQEKILAAAREAFAEGGEETSLEEIARRAGVGIGTLYRNFPNRQALLEAVYVGEVELLCGSAGRLDQADPGEALNGWLMQFVGYIATKQALAHELMNYLDPDSPLFGHCRSSIYAAGEPLLRRAQEAGAVRPDVDIGQVTQLVIAISKAPLGGSGETAHLVRVALDGLRCQPQP